VRYMCGRIKKEAPINSKSVVDYLSN